MQNRENPPAIPESEMEITFARSGGPGGQNVNKVESKAVIRWNVDRSAVLSDGQKQRLKERLASRLTVENDLVIHANEERSREQNRRSGIARLQRIVEEALHEDEERIATRPSRSSVEKRLDEKKHEGRKKAERRRKND